MIRETGLEVAEEPRPRTVQDHPLAGPVTVPIGPAIDTATQSLRHAITITITAARTPETCLGSRRPTPQAEQSNAKT